MQRMHLLNITHQIPANPNVVDARFGCRKRVLRLEKRAHERAESPQNGMAKEGLFVGGLFYVEGYLADENLRFAREGIEREQALPLPIRAVQLKRVSGDPIWARGGADATTCGTAGTRRDGTAGAGVRPTRRGGCAVAIGNGGGAS